MSVAGADGGANLQLIYCECHHVPLFLLPSDYKPEPLSCTELAILYKAVTVSAGDSNPDNVAAPPLPQLGAGFVGPEQLWVPSRQHKPEMLGTKPRADNSWYL